MPPIDDRWNELAAALGRALGRDVIALAPLTGGASRETFRFATDDGATFILQRERTEVPRRPQGMAAEAEIVRAARSCGVSVPEVVLSNADLDEPAIGASFFVSRAVDGETIARRILRSPEFRAARHALPAQLGSALAAVHRIDPAPLTWLDDGDELDKYRVIADELGLRRPAFEVAFRWLAANRPPDRPRRVVHGDFRLGNLLVDEDGLAAVIDWELAHLSDPMEDLGWLCVRAWRFGGPSPVAGIGEYAELFEAYEAAGGEAVDPDVVRWWQILGALKWGIMCGLQADTHRSGAYRSLELLAIGRRIAEQEHDVLALISESAAPEAVIESASSTLSPIAIDQPDEPTLAELITALRERLDEATQRPLEGFEARVARNVAAIAERELANGAATADAHQARLMAFGARSDAELAAMIRSGETDDRFPPLIRALSEAAVDRLAINNPRWLE